MAKRPKIQNMKGHSKKKSKLPLQDIEVNSIEQLIVQPSQSSSKTKVNQNFVLDFDALQNEKRNFWRMESI
jgi:hypothetical protein